MTKVIVVPDDDDKVNKAGIAPGILAMLDQNTVLMSADGLRMYIRETMHKNMQDGAKTTGGV